MHLFGYNLRRWDFWKELISFRSLVIVSPVFLLTVKHWTNLVVLVVFFGSFFFLFRKKEVNLQYSDELKRWHWIIVLTLIGPVLAVGIGQLLRRDFYPPNFDAPLRIALCTPIFLAISRGWLYRYGKDTITFLWVKYTFPLTLIWTFIDRPSWTDKWPQHITTYFVDPLSFGSLTLLFALLSFAALSFFWNRINWIVRFISLLSVLVGFYFSVKSGSRTGWLNFPVFISIWLFAFAFPTLGRARSLLVLLCMSLTAGAFIATSPYFVSKILVGINEVLSYQWNSQNIEGSADIRLSFYRMAIFYFLHNPLQGWGDLGWKALSNSPEIVQYASELARQFPEKGFHNEILTNSIRSGVWGLASSVAFFLCPILWAIKTLRQYTILEEKFLCFFVLFLMLHLFLAGLTTEVTNLVFLASFSGLSIAVMVGEGQYSSRAANTEPPAE
jgi:O-antigen ligase